MWWDGKIAVAEDGMYGIQEKAGTAAEVSEGEPDVDVPESLKEHAEELEKALAGVDTTGRRARPTTWPTTTR